QQQQQDDAYVQETSSSSSSTSSYSTTSSEVSSDSERRGSGSAPLANTRSHTRPPPFLRSDRQLQKTSESPARPAAASGHTHDAGGLRRSSRKRTQRDLLDTQSRPLSPSPLPPQPPTAPVLRSSTRSRSGNRRQASGGGGGGGSGVRPRSTGPGTSADQRRASRSAAGSQQQQQQNKRRHISGAKKSQAIGGSSNSSSSSSPFTCSVDSQLDFEVSIYTEGTAVPAAVPAAAETVAQTCFMCNKVIGGDGDAVNAHIDQCLARSAGESPSNEASEANGRADGSMMVAYEWDGQVRIRATAMLEGGVVGAGLGTATAAWYRDNDDDIDVDQEDETDYGPAQYSDRDLVLAGGGRSRGRSGGGNSGHSRQLSGPQFEEFVAPDDTPLQPQEGPSLPPPSANPDTPSQTANRQHQSPSASLLVIDALKERIGQQDRLLQCVQKCLICLEPYEKPCASIHCWHVYCEKCWMLTLGAKKLCPQCLQITQPTDLRRIYL
ncbi:hypothetical protein LPJ72_003775, partial [Coemansia sp. Benny D160-2]